MRKFVQWDRKTLFYFVLLVHVASLICFSYLYFKLDREYYIRWHLGHIVVLIATFTPVAMLLLLPRWKHRVLLRVFLVLFILVSWCFAFLNTVSGHPLFAEREFFCEDGQYVLRKHDELMELPRVALYKKEGIIEHYLCDYGVSTVDSARVYEHLNAIVLYCPKLAEYDNLRDNDWNREVRRIYPLPFNGLEFNALHRKELDSLIKSERMEIHYIGEVDFGW